MQNGYVDGVWVVVVWGVVGRFSCDLCQGIALVLTPMSGVKLGVICVLAALPQSGSGRKENRYFEVDDFRMLARNSLE